MRSKAPAGFGGRLHAKAQPPRGAGPSVQPTLLWPGTQMLPAVRRYDQKPNPGSDHQMLMITLSLDALAGAAAPGPGDDNGEEIL